MNVAVYLLMPAVCFLIPAVCLLIYRLIYGLIYGLIPAVYLLIYRLIYGLVYGLIYRLIYGLTVQFYCATPSLQNIRIISNNIVILKHICKLDGNCFLDDRRESMLTAHRRSCMIGGWRYSNVLCRFKCSVSRLVHWLQTRGSH